MSTATEGLKIGTSAEASLVEDLDSEGADSSIARGRGGGSMITSSAQ